jgi:cyclopropane fatty-acyl-phospholipid synthase-like methyltransferase
MKQLPFAEACERNKGPILEILKEVLPSRGRILEIGAGTGQHLVFFAPHFPGLKWQSSDCSENLGGLAARISLEASPNILPPIELDVLGNWPGQLFDAVYSANTAHIMAWHAVCAMFAGLELHLAPGGVFCLYGPFNRNGRFTAASNAEFDRQLRERSSEMGLRDVEALESLAQRHQMILVRQYPMPANNQVLVFRRTEVPGSE